MNDQIVHVAASVVSVGIGVMWLGLLHFKLWPDARREKFQQKLFKLRNDLFLWMVERDYDLSNSAYIETRDLLNGCIRFARQINIPMVLAGAAFLPKKEQHGTADYMIDGELKDELQAVKMKLAWEILKYIGFSVPGALAMVGFIAWFLAKGCRSTTGTKNDRRMQMVKRFRPVQEFMREAAACY